MSFKLPICSPLPLLTVYASAIKSWQLSSPPPSPARLQLRSSHANSSIKIKVYFSMQLTASPCKVTFPFGNTKKKSMTPFTLALILMWAVGRCLFFISLQIRKRSSTACHYCIQTCYSSSVVEQSDYCTDERKWERSKSKPSIGCCEVLCASLRLTAFLTKWCR